MTMIKRNGSFCFLSSALLLVLAGCASPVEKSGGKFCVFKDNKAASSIVLPSNASDDLKKAVDEFRKDLLRGYQVDLPVGDAPNLPGRIELVVEDRSLENEDKTEITFSAENVMRITGGESGVMRALFRLLEDEAGVRYLYMGKHGTWFPPIAELTIPRKTMKFNSSFPLNRSSNKTTFGKDRKYWWGWEFRLGTKSRLLFNHDLSKIAFPMKIYREKGQCPDVRMFPFLAGSRFLPYKHFPARKYDSGFWQPCCSGKVAVDTAVKNLLAYLMENPRTRSLSLSVNDCGGYCECEACLKLDHGGKAPNSLGYANRSESYYRWLNQVVGQVSSQYPDVVFGCLAYMNVTDPPSFNLHPNIVPFLCFDTTGCNDPEIMAKRKKLIRDWSEKAVRFGHWDYEFGNICYTLPRVSFTAKQEITRYLRDFGGIASFTESCYFTADEGPKMYLSFKLLENPDLDLEATLKDWCVSAVGRDAAPYLRQYYGFWEEFWRTQVVKTPWWQSRNAVYMQLVPFGTYMYGLKPGDMARCRQLMEKTLELAMRHGTEDQQARALLLMRCFEWYEAAAIACGAEIFLPNGTLPDAAAAVRLLQRVPLARRSYEKWLAIPSQTDDWYAYEIFAGRDKSVVESTLAAVRDFLTDPAVRVELKKLANNKQCSAMTRFMTATMLKGIAGDNTGNMLENGSFEKDGNDGWATSQPIHGKVGSAAGNGVNGTRALKCDIQHENFTATKVMLNAKPNTSYFCAARIFIPANQPPGLTQEGRLQFWGNPTSENGAKHCAWPASRPEARLDAGKWHYVCAVVPPHEKADSVRLYVRLYNFGSGATAYIDDVQLFEMPQDKL